MWATVRDPRHPVTVGGCDLTIPEGKVWADHIGGLTIGTARPADRTPTLFPDRPRLTLRAALTAADRRTRPRDTSQETCLLGGGDIV